MRVVIAFLRSVLPAGSLLLLGAAGGRGLRPRRGAGAERRPADRHARLRRPACCVTAALRRWQGQETVMSLLMRNDAVTHPLRRRLRAEHRRALRRSGSGTAGRLVLLRQRRRGDQGRGRHERASRRSHLVGPPRLEPDRGRARGRRVLPRAVPQRHRRQAPAGARRMRDVAGWRLRAPSPRGCAASASRRRSRRSAAAARRRRCA